MVSFSSPRCAIQPATVILTHFTFPRNSSGIPPGESFSYSVPVNTSDQWGTYWWHAHSNGQYVDGLRSALTLHPPVEVYSNASASNTSYYAPEDDITVILGDWYHDEHSVLIDQFVNIANPGGAEPIPDAALIYFAKNGTYLGPVKGTTGTTGVGFNENSTIPFEAGKTYRLRLVNAAAFAGFFFWIDGHEMRMIEVDGVSRIFSLRLTEISMLTLGIQTDITETPIDVINLAVAQRYSILVTARNDTSPSNWVIHAAMDTTMFDTVPDSLNPNATSTITYSTDSSAPLYGTDTVIDTFDMVNDTLLVPVQVIALPPPATRTIPLEFTFDTMNDGTNHAMFNLTTYNSPLTPAILSALTLGSNAMNEAAYGPLSFAVNHLDVIDIVIMNGDTGQHPFHLHGHKPFIAGRSIDYTSSDPTLNPPINESQTNPMRRDTFLIPSGESITLRVVADNPGAWLLHCHIEWHLEVGLAMQLIEAPLTAQTLPGPPAILGQQCNTLGLPSSGNAAGHTDSPTDLVGLPLGPYPQVLGWKPKGIVAMFGCVLTAVLGMISVVWYALGEHFTEEEMEREARDTEDKKAARRAATKGLFGLRKRT